MGESRDRPYRVSQEAPQGEAYISECIANHTPSWVQVWQGIQLLAKAIPLDVELIRGQPRGGLVIASLLTYARPSLTVSQELLDGNDVLIEDVVETGRTLSLIPHKECYALYDKPLKAAHHPEFAVWHCTCNQYIQFPWEVKNARQTSNQ